MCLVYLHACITGSSSSHSAPSISDVTSCKESQTDIVNVKLCDSKVCALQSVSLFCIVILSECTVYVYSFCVLY